MNSILKDSFILFIIAAIAAASLGIVYEITAPAIAYQFELAQTQAKQNVVPSATTFEEVADIELAENVTGLYYAYDDSSELVGYVVSAITFGYGGQIDLMIGYNLDLTINNIDIVKHAETPGLGALADNDEFKSQFPNKTGELAVVKTEPVTDNEISAITSSTITSTAVVNGVNDATNFITDYKEVLINE